MNIHGNVAKGYEGVRDTFQRNFAEHGEVGAGCCVRVDGEMVVDLWGGTADPATGRAWEADTPSLIFSATKGLTAICIHRLVQQGLLDLDAPVARYWPEFAVADKGSIPVRWVLSHRAGVPAVDQPFTLTDLLDWHGVVAAVAAQKPEWAPGSKHGYHARTFGWIVGEIVRRITGRSPGQFFAEDVARPLGLDCWIGLPEEIEPRVAAIVPPDPVTDPQTLAMMEQIMGPHTLLGRVMNKPDDLFTYDQRRSGPCSERAYTLQLGLLALVDGVLECGRERVRLCRRRRLARIRRSRSWARLCVHPEPDGSHGLRPVEWTRERRLSSAVATSRPRTFPREPGCVVEGETRGARLRRESRRRRSSRGRRCVPGLPASAAIATSPRAQIAQER
jgi:hypothetical protein